MSVQRSAPRVGWGKSPYCPPNGQRVNDSSLQHAERACIREVQKKGRHIDTILDFRAFHHDLQRLVVSEQSVSLSTGDFPNDAQLDQTIRLFRLGA
jgi:hypothetical protein